MKVETSDNKPYKVYLADFLIIALWTQNIKCCLF